MTQLLFLVIVIFIITAVTLGIVRGALECLLCDTPGTVEGPVFSNDSHYSSSHIVIALH